MIGLRGYRREPKPERAEEPRVIPDEASVEALLQVDDVVRLPYCTVLDVGRAKDYSVLVIMSLDPRTRPYRIRLERIEIAPHGTSSTDLAEAVGSAQAALIARGHPVFSALDATGIGSGTAELVDLRSAVNVKVEITGDGRVIEDKWEPWRYKVPKRELVDALVTAMQAKTVTVSSNIDARTRAEFIRQVTGFSRIIAPNKDGSAKVTYGNDSAVADHDDIVLAVAIGIWSFQYLADMGMFGGFADPDAKP